VDVDVDVDVQWMGSSRCSFGMDGGPRRRTSQTF